MSQILNPKIFSWLTTLFISLGVTKLLWSLLLFILPTTPPFVQSVKTSPFVSGSLSLGDKFLPTGQDQMSKLTTRNLSNITLKAIYKKPNAGFAILEDKGAKIYLDLEQKYKGYKLIEIHTRDIILEKEEELYKIQLSGYKPKGSDQ